MSEHNYLPVSACENGEDFVDVLPSVDDDHGGVIVEIKTTMDPDSFVLALRSSIEQWRLKGKKGVWINLPIANANLVEPAVKEGFMYHHAEPTYLMFVHWIPETASTIPANASHRVGVGVIVLNDKKEILVVQEKSGPLRGSGVWKIPTGVVDEGEEIFAAAIREVKEETGIETVFQEVLAFRQTHESFFVKSDIVFLCLSRPITFNIQKQELEIAAAQWMAFEDYASQPITKNSELFDIVQRLGVAKMEKGYIGFSPQPIKSFFDNKLGFIYFNKQELDKSNCSSVSS